MLAGFLTVAVGTVVFTVTRGSVSAAAKLAPEMGVLAMAVSMLITPAVSAFTKKFDSKFLDGVFLVKEDE